MLQAVVDDRGLFRNIYVGLPGSTHDAAVLRQSGLYINQDVHPKGSISIEGIDIPLMLAGDPAYPLLPWLMKAYPGPMLSPAEEAFNKHLNAIRVAVEHSFGRLKARWRVLSRQSDINYRFMPTVIAACCVLHNMCEKDSILLDSPDVGLEPCIEPPGCLPPEDVPSTEATVIRNTVLKHIQNKLSM